MRRVKLGDVEFDVVEDENPKDSATVTDKPVESGQDVSDHAKLNPSIINIRGQMTEDAAEKLQVLKKYLRERTLLKYVGRNAYDNVVIEDLDRVHGVKNRQGFQFNIRLKQVRIATAKEVEINIASPKDATKVKPVTNKGKQQPKQKRVADNQTKVMNHGMIAMMR